MDFLRAHWYDLGGIFGVLVLSLLAFFHRAMAPYEILQWLSLVALFCHQLEEYRVVGTFPGMVNKVMFKSRIPDRYPLNTNTALVINVWLGWTLYLVAAIFGQKLIWLGMAATLVSLGNIAAHTILFNIKGRPLYNAGLVTCWLCFAPCVFYFFQIIHSENLVAPVDYFIGISLGLAINIFGVFKPISWLADRNTTYVFKRSQLLPSDRQL